MTPVAFHENNTSFLNLETSVVLIFAVLLLIWATFHNIRKVPDKHSWKAAIIIQCTLALCAVLVFTGFTAYKEHRIHNVEELMIQQIESSKKVDDLTIIDETSIYCSDSYSGSINAVTWTEDDMRKTGLLIGEKNDSQCRFIIEETARENVLEAL